MGKHSSLSLSVRKRAEIREIFCLFHHFFRGCFIIIQDGSRTSESPVAGKGTRKGGQDEEAAGPQCQSTEEGCRSRTQVEVLNLHGPDARPEDVQAALREQAPKGRSPGGATSHITLLKSLTMGWGRPSSCRSSPWVGSQGPSTGLVDLSASSPVPTLLCIFPRLVFDPLRRHTIQIEFIFPLIGNFIRSICEVWLWEVQLRCRSRPDTYMQELQEEHSSFHFAPFCKKNYPISVEKTTTWYT